ncbi:MAG TPA: BON domain-containing protein [Symbiobacteriaceae bacterium]|nr:BON domain-containing protein [Symbiobacteriaceae bacterium]
MSNNRRVNYRSTQNMDPTEFNHDIYLRNQVKEALQKGTDSAGVDVKVECRDGVINLFGVVDVLSQRTQASEIARTIPGIKEISNNITVADEEHHSDKWIQGELTKQLQRSPWGQSLGCEVKRGVVTILGHAGAAADVADAIRLAEGFPGVAEVIKGHVKIGEHHRADERDMAYEAEHLLDHMGFDHQDFEVSVDGGTLHVKGFVHDREDRTKIRERLGRIPGVETLDALLVTDDQVADAEDNILH